MFRHLATPYFRELENRISRLGGMLNAHLHLDRAGTYHETVRLLAETNRDGAILPLSGKHALIPRIHASSCYERGELKARANGYLNSFIEAGTRRADTLVDVTDDGIELRALDVFLELKSDHSPILDFRVGAYNPLGFRDDQPRRWDLLLEGVAKADFIGLLPERDDRTMYPEHIGFDESCRRSIALSLQTRKQIHIHVDQANHRHEAAAEAVVSIARQLGAGVPAHAEPMIWLIHLISPSTYEEPRFQRLVADLAELNIGVICCPSAAISMRQYRPLLSPTYNSIARVLDLLAGGVQVRVASDNICDVTSPMGTPDLMDEMLVLANAVRFYDIEIMAKLAAGVRLDETDIERVRRHLTEDAAIVASTVAGLG
jgi:cytosine/creatinine deaminase